MKFLDLVRKKNKKIILALILIVFGVLGRIFRVHFLPTLHNVEPITLASLFAGAFLGGGYALIVPLAIVALTDMYIGNSPILIFTWTAWAVIGLAGLLLRKSKKEKFSFGFKMFGMGILASVFFFLWTNFGVWVITDWYPRTWQGLVFCYVMGLPFLKMNLMGNLIIIPVASFSLILILKYVKALKEKKTKIAKLLDIN